jgi:chromosome segregation ATPase
MKEEKAAKNDVTSSEDEKRSLSYELEELNGTRADRLADLEDKQQKDLLAMAPIVADLTAKLSGLQEEVQRQQDEYNEQDRQSQTFLQKIEEVSTASDKLDKEKEKKRRILSKAAGEPERMKGHVAMQEGVVKGLTGELARLDDEIKATETSLASLTV